MPERRKHEGKVHPTAFRVRQHQRPYSGKLFTLDTAKVEWGSFDNPNVPNGPDTIEIARRGDAVAAILFDRDKREVILVEQFRLATTRPFRKLVDNKKPLEPVDGDYEFQDGWLIETVAGAYRDTSRTPEDCLKDELLHEAGYRVNRVREIGKFFASPGGTSEMIHLFYAEVSDLQREPSQGGGNPREREDIDVLHFPIEEFFTKLERREFLDAKVIIAGYWLRDNLTSLQAQPRNAQIRSITHSVLGTDQKIGIKIGSITDVKGIQVWVNPENTTMQMDRYFGRSVSAAIRWSGAKRELRAGETDPRRAVVVRDWIADDLRRKLRNRYHVALGEVIETTSGELKKENGVLSILHVAIAEGHFEQGMRTKIETLQVCADKVLDTIEHANWNSRLLSPYRSVLIPMIGAGSGGLHVRDIAPALVERGLEFFRRNPTSRLREIYFNAFVVPDVIYLQQALGQAATRGNAAGDPPDAQPRTAAGEPAFLGPPSEHA